MEIDRFSQVLDVKKGITAVAGSGGKTSLIARLAREVSVNGSVIICTTTKIMRPQNSDVYESLAKRLSPGQICCVGSTLKENEKKLTAPRQEIAELAKYADYVLVEADGSRMRPLKCHRAFEPVIPEGCHDIIWVVGMSGIGKRIDEAVHCPELWDGIAGKTTESEEPAYVTEEKLACVLASELQGFGAYDLRVFMNQADTEELFSKADRLASELQKRAGCSRFQLFAGSVLSGTIRKCGL